MRRFILTFIIVLIVLITGVTGVGWYLLQNESFLKSRLSANSLKYTGRELVVSGPMKLKLGWVTRLEATGVRFADADWADRPDMVTIGHLELSVEIPSLFGDQPVFPHLGLRDCTIFLQKNNRGQANWGLVQRADKPPKPKSEQRKDLPVRLNDLVVDHCELVMSGPRLKQPLDIEISGLSMQHHGDNRWEGNGNGSINDKSFSFNGWLNPFSALFYGGRMEHELKAGVGDISLQSSGSVQDASDWSGANITARFQGPEISDILNEFQLPLFSEGAFDYQLKLNTEGGMTKVNMDGNLGSVDIGAAGQLDRLIKPTEGNIRFTVDGPNLGALARVFGLDGLVEDGFSHETRATFQEGVIQIDKATLQTDLDQVEIGGHFNTGPGFAGTALTVHFHSDEAGRWTTLLGQPQQALGQLDLDGKLSSDAQGLVSIQAKAVQGATTMDANGTLGRIPGSLEPVFDIVFSSPDPSHLAAVAGLKRLPAAPLTIKGRFARKQRQLTLGNVNVNLAGNRAEIDGMLGLDNRYAGSDLKLGLDIGNLADLGRLFGKDGLPDQPLKLDAAVKPSGEGLSLKVNNGNLGKIRITLDGRIPDLQKPLVMDGEFDISLPRLRDLSLLFPEHQLPDAAFTAQGKIERNGQQLRLQRVFVNLADDNATIEGILNLENRYAGSDLDIHLDIKNAGQLARSFGRDGIPDQPLVLDAEVKPAGKGLAFKINDGNLGDIQLDLVGQIADLERPTGLNARFDIHLPRLSDVSFLVPGRELPDVPFKASGQLLNEEQRTRLDQVQVEVGKIKAGISGDLLPENRFRLSVQAAGEDVSGLASVLGQTLKPEPFSLSTQIEGNAAEFELKDIQVTLGENRVHGELRIGLGDITRVHGSLDSPYFDVSQWIADPEVEEDQAQQQKPRWRFDDSLVMDLVDFGYDLDLDITVDHLKQRNAYAQELKLGLILTRSLFQLKPFMMKGERGGSFSGWLSLDESGVKPRLQVVMKGEDIRIGLTALPGQDPSTYPPVAIDLALDGTGTTHREMASSLNGKFRAYHGTGQVAAAGLSLFFSNFFTELFTLLNPFAKTSKYTQLDCAVAAADAVSGMVEVFPVIYNTEQLTILSQGTIDLNTEKIDLSFNTKPRKGLGISAGVLINPLIKVGGTLTAPAIELDPASTVANTGLAVATVGISLLAKSMSDRFLSSPDPCGDARKEIAKRDGEDG